MWTGLSGGRSTPWNTGLGDVVMVVTMASASRRRIGRDHRNAEFGGVFRQKARRLSASRL